MRRLLLTAVLSAVALTTASAEQMMLLGVGKRAAVGASPLLTNLVAYWELDEANGNAIDAHGSNDLTNENTVGASAGGGPSGNDVRHFDPNFGEVFSADDGAVPDLSLSTDTPLTIAAFVRLDTTTGFQGVVVKDGAYELTFASGADFRFTVLNGVSSATADASSNASSLTWYFIVAQHDPTANTVGISIDNGAFSTAAWSGGTHDGTGAMWLGKMDVGNLYLDGKMCCVGIWKQVLSPDEIAWLYNAGAGRTYAEIAAYAP